MDSCSTVSIDGSSPSIVSQASEEMPQPSRLPPPTAADAADESSTQTLLGTTKSGGGFCCLSRRAGVASLLTTLVAAAGLSVWLISLPTLPSDCWYCAAAVTEPPPMPPWSPPPPSPPMLPPRPCDGSLLGSDWCAHTLPLQCPWCLCNAISRRDLAHASPSTLSIIPLTRHPREAHFALVSHGPCPWSCAQLAPERGGARLCACVWIWSKCGCSRDPARWRHATRACHAHRAPRPRHCHRAEQRQRRRPAR